LQNSKQELAIISTDEGMQIDSSDEQFANADFPRCESRQPESNVKSERFLHSLKQKGAIVSIDEGMIID
jgi:hypothetical protein